MTGPRTTGSPHLAPGEPEPAAAEASRGPLRVLFVAGAEGAEHLLESLRRGGYEPSARRVESPEELSEALQPGAWDVAICEDDLATLDGPTALRLIKTTSPWLPVIIVSSQFGESVAAAAMKAGADDFVASGFLARLVPAVEREIRAASMRRGWKEAAQSLADVRLRSTAFMDNNPAIAFFKDEEGRLAYVNRTFERVFRVTYESLRGKTDSEWLPADLAVQTQAHDEEVLAADRPMEFEEKLPAAEGFRNWLVFKFPFRDHSGRRFVGGVGIDITERKRAAEALRDSEDHYRDLVEHTQALICVHDLEGRLLTVNDAAARSLGYDRETDLGREVVTIRDIMTPDTRAGFEQYIQEIRAKGSVDGIMAVQTREGERRYWEYHNTLRTEGVETPVVRGLAFDVTEKLQARQALRVSEERFRTLVENSSDVIVLVGGDGRIRYVSPSLTRVLGYAIEEHLGRLLSDFLHPEDVERARGTFASLLERPGRSVTSEGRIRHKNGTWRFIESVSTNHLAEPAIQAVVVNFRDITERRRAEAAVRESERRFRALIENSSDAIALFGADGQVLYGSPATKRILGYELFEFVGRNALELIHPDDRGFVKASLAESLEKPGAMVPVHAHVLHRDGSWRFMEGVFTNLLDDPGVGAIVNNYRDVTERQQAEQSVRASEARYRTLFERNLAGVYRSTRDGRILECNEAFARIYGYASREEVLGLPAADLNPDPKQRALFLDALAATGAVTNYEGAGRRKDGGALWTIENAVLLPDGNGGDFIEGTVIDVTDRRQLEEQLRQAQKMEAIGRLAGGVAHDFNNLLTAILGYSDMMLSQIAYDSPLREDAEEIRKAGERAAALTRQLLAFSRKQRLEPKVLDLNSLIGDVQRMLQRMIGEDIELATSLAPDLSRVRADPGQLEQVIMNLAVNARDAMPNGGKLTIETQNAELDEEWGAGRFTVQPGAYVMVAVTDTGSGMDEETKSHIFEPFFTTKPQGKGTGLGLATVYGIVKQSGGYVWVYSEPGAGTAFRIYLPQHAEALEPAARPVEESRPSPRGRETILLVEDEEGVRALARKVLSMQGYQILEAAGPEAALDLLERHAGSIDLLLSDVVMPGMAGPELASRVVARRPGLKVLLMSGYSDHAAAGATALLQKPFTPEMLARRVREALSR